MQHASAPTRHFLVLLLFVAPLAVFAQDKGPTDFTCDFRNQRELPAGLELVNDRDREFCRLEPEGLRITIPRTATHGLGGVGVRTTFAMPGDFDVIVTAQVLSAERPPTGSGSGITMYLPTVTGKDAVFIGRMHTKKGKQILLCSRQHIDETGQHWAQHPRPCEESLLRIRLKRTGKTVSYQFAPGVEGGTFEEVHREEFGDDPIERIRLTAANQQTEAAMDIRVLQLQVRSDFPPLPAEPRAERAGLRLVKLLLVGIGAVLVAGLAAYVWKRRRSFDSCRGVSTFS